MPTLLFDSVKILGVINRDYVGSDGANRTFKAVQFRYENNLMQLPLDRNATSEAFERALDKEVSLECTISTFGSSLEPTLRASTVVIKG